MEEEQESRAVRGKPGATGAQGPTGPQGIIGPQGGSGVEGGEGLQGEAGPKGSKGETGSQGEPGVAGPKGESGAKNQELLEALQNVDSDLGFRINTRKRMKILVGALVVVLLMLVLTVYSLLNTRKNQSKIIKVQEEACERDNLLRKNYVDMWTPVLIANPLPPEPPIDSSQEVLDAYASQVELRERFASSLVDGFAQHDC